MVSVKLTLEPSTGTNTYGYWQARNTQASATATMTAVGSICSLSRKSYAAWRAASVFMTSDTVPPGLRATAAPMLTSRAVRRELPSCACPNSSRAHCATSTAAESCLMPAKQMN